MGRALAASNGVNRLRFDTENFHGSASMNILSPFESRRHFLVLRNMRGYSQLDLRIVKGNQLESGRRDKRFSKFLSQLGLYGYVLKIRVLTGKTSGSSGGLAGCCMKTPRRFTYKGRKRVYVGRLKFLNLPILKYQVNNRMLLNQLFKFAGGGRKSTFGCFSNP